MNFVLEVRAEVHKRQQLLISVIQLKDLAAVIVSYAVTELQLVEEAILRRHFFISPTRQPIYAEAKRIFLALSETREPLIQLYLHKMSSALAAGGRGDLSRVDMFCNAMMTHLLSPYCQRFGCFYGTMCTCNRPLMTKYIEQGLVISYF